MKKIFLAGILVALSVSISVPAAEAGLFGRKKAAPQEAPNPQLAINSDEAFKDNAKALHKVPFDDPKLEFNIMLPKDWTIAPSAKVDTLTDLNRKIMRDAAKFVSPIIGTAQASVSVQSLYLDREIAAKDWLKNYILSNGYTLSGDITTTGEKRASAFFVALSEQKSSYAYATVQISGDVAMIASFESPMPLKEQLAFVQKKVIDSFELVQLSGAPVEPQKNFTLGNALKFNYPLSWTVNYPNFKDLSNMSVQLHNTPKENQVEGVIRFIAVRRNSRTNLMGEIDNLKKSLDDVWALDFKKLISSGKAGAYNRFPFARYEVYRVGLRKKNVVDQEVRLAVLGDKDWYIFMFLLTPSASDKFYVWANNVATFDLIIRNLR